MRSAAPRGTTLVASLVVANVLVWVWAAAAFRAYPVVLGTALLAYGLGLRHAFDADHIAAIDNVTRKLMQDGDRPIGVGFFFALGHSTVVVLASIMIALATAAARSRLASFRGAFGSLGTFVSAGFLLGVAVMNLAILVSVYRAFRRVQSGGYLEADDSVVNGGKFMARIFRPVFRAIRGSWQMYPLGFLFGLGFDTATEIGLLGIAAAEAAKGMSPWAILVFPALFTAGMSLVDTADGVLMASAYGWAYLKPARKLNYNLTITAVSVVCAVLVAGVEVSALLVDKLALHGAFWSAVSLMASHFGVLGYVIVAVFAVTWLIALVVYRLKGYDGPDGARARYL